MDTSPTLPGSRAAHARGALGALGALATLVLLVGCGAQDSSTDPADDAPAASGGPAPPSSTSASTSPAAPTSSGPVLSPTPPSEARASVRVTGTVVSPPDASGCVGLTSVVGVQWVLTGPAVADLDAGERVRVVGSPRPAGGPCGEEAVLAVEEVVPGG